MFRCSAESRVPSPESRKCSQREVVVTTERRVEDLQRDVDFVVAKILRAAKNLRDPRSMRRLDRADSKRGRRR
jgi:hypothetical protein